MVETIYIARHGFRANWVTTHWKSQTGLPRDPPLAGYGVIQSQELADHFVSLPVEERPTAIFSSPYYRCLQTAKPVAAALGVPIFVEHGISEWYAPVVPGTGLHPRPASASALRTHFPEIDDTWTSVWYPPRKGEDVDEVHCRAAAFLATFLPAMDRRWPGPGPVSAHARILLVSHAATIIALARALVGDMALPVRVGCCSLTELVCSRVDLDVGADTGIGTRALLGAWVPRRLGDGSHLKDGASRAWAFEDALTEDGKIALDPGEPGSENDTDSNFGPQSQLVSHL